MQFLSIGPDLIAIWGLKAKKYLAVDNKGKIFATVSFYGDIRARLLLCINMFFFLYITDIKSLIFTMRHDENFLNNK